LTSHAGGSVYGLCTFWIAKYIMNGDGGDRGDGLDEGDEGRRNRLFSSSYSLFFSP
jgi:hypothetical protein